MRYHELALQRWLNRLFFVREGFPVPVVFTSPMDAFSHFQQLWSEDTNPFKYLFDLKDASGTPLYEPHPSPVRYPIISAHRKGWKLRQYQNFSIHRWRHINWPTVANAGPERYGPQAQGWDLTKCNLGNVTTSRMPMAWDYRFQIDHFCNRPDTQAFFVEQLMQEFWRTGGTVPQTWIAVPYPGWGNRRVRLYIDGDIENLTPEEPEDGKNVEFRTSFTVVIEGFDVDLRYEIYPALWNLVMRFGPVDPVQLEDCFNLTHTTDLRVSGSNTTLDRRPNVPTWGTCQDVIKDIGAPDQTIIEIVGVNETANNQFGVFTVGTLAAIAPVNFSFAGSLVWEPYGYGPSMIPDSGAGSVSGLGASFYGTAWLINPDDAPANAFDIGNDGISPDVTPVPLTGTVTLNILSANYPPGQCSFVLAVADYNSSDFYLNYATFDPPIGVQTFPVSIPAGIQVDAWSGVQMGGLPGDYSIQWTVEFGF